MREATQKIRAQVRAMNHAELTDNMHGDQSELNKARQREHSIRHITASGVEHGKAFLSGMIEMHEELDSKPEQTKWLISIIDESIERTSSKVLTQTLTKAKQKLEAA